MARLPHIGGVDRLLDSRPKAMQIVLSRCDGRRCGAYSIPRREPFKMISTERFLGLYSVKRCRIVRLDVI